MKYLSLTLVLLLTLLIGCGKEKKFSYLNQSLNEASNLTKAEFLAHQIGNRYAGNNGPMYGSELGLPNVFIERVVINLEPARVSVVANLNISVTGGGAHRFDKEASLEQKRKIYNTLLEMLSKEIARKFSIHEKLISIEWSNNSINSGTYSNGELAF